MQLLLREAEPQDIEYIVTSWTAAHGTVQRLAESSLYELRQKAAIRRRLASTTALIAHLEDTRDLILGWAVGSAEDLTLDYVFVKHAYRRTGIAKKLIGALLPPKGPYRFTHPPAAFVKLNPDPNKWVYDAYAFLLND